VTSALAKGGKGRKSSEPESMPPSNEGARVGGLWQKRLIERLEAEKLDEAWGVFSEGGWSDVGQVMLLANKNKSKFLLLTVKPNDREKSDSKAFTKGQWDTLWPVIDKASSLGDIDEQMFDGLIYEYVHFTRDANGQVKAAKRVYIKSTGREPHKDHDALVKAFFDLRGEAN
jgi:hypothetical protein